MPKTQATKATPTEKPAVATKAEKVEKPTLVTTSQLAAQLGTKPTILRRYLRSLPAYQDNQYSRYGWEPGDQFLADVTASFAKYQTKEADKKAKREAEAKTVKPAKEAKPTKGKKPEPEPLEEEDVFDNEDEVEEIE